MFLPVSGRLLIWHWFLGWRWFLRWCWFLTWHHFFGRAHSLGLTWQTCVEDLGRHAIGGGANVSFCRGPDVTLLGGTLVCCHRCQNPLQVRRADYFPRAIQLGILDWVGSVDRLRPDLCEGSPRVPLLRLIHDVGLVRDGQVPGGQGWDWEFVLGRPASGCLVMHNDCRRSRDRESLSNDASATGKCWLEMDRDRGRLWQKLSGQHLGFLGNAAVHRPY